MMTGASRAERGAAETGAPRVVVVDASRAVRMIIARLLRAEIPDCIVFECESAAAAERVLDDGEVDLVTTALQLPDVDGRELARRVRARPGAARMPVIVVSGSVEETLANEPMPADVTDYFDKGEGAAALAEFIRGYLHPPTAAQGTVLYVEDSRVVSAATTRLLERYGLTVRHVTSVEGALELLADIDSDARPVDIVLTDLSLKGELGGADLLETIRIDMGLGRHDLPVLVMTGDENPKSQAALLRAGANDLVHKPVEERLLATKLIYQLRVAQRQRDRGRE